MENTGREIAPAQAARLFDPFIRLDADRTGSAGGAGLGLSIVRAIARAHSGTAEARPREGGGLLVTIRLRRPCQRLSSSAPIHTASRMTRPSDQPDVREDFISLQDIEITHDHPEPEPADPFVDETADALDEE